MRKETINTFSDGMSLDLNPLGTPAKTLTNCLNGTLITYNGNELTLQNDMGNVPVGTAYLPHGYVPVGMKEHGGIIYVASYNPATGKGQLGCFPSPLQIYVSEAAQTTLEINILDLFILFLNDKIPAIEFNEYKEEIFKDVTTLEPRVFNTGDKFLIKVEDKLSDEIRAAIDENILVFKLFIIPSNGDPPIEISSCDRTDLKLYLENTNWNQKLWIYLNCGGIYQSQVEGEDLVPKLPFENILNDHREFLQVYPGPQGTLEIVIEFNTFKLFNLYRLFYRNGGEFSVRFTGEAFADDTNPCNIVNELTLIPLELVGNIDSQGHDLSKSDVLDTEKDYSRLVSRTKKLYNIIGNNTLYYDIMAASLYGALKLFNNSFLKSGELTNQGILAAHNKITNWDFEINSDSATILWTYTTFDGDPLIDHMRFVFIPLEKVLEGGSSKSYLDLLYITSSERTEPTDLANIYTIKKLYYSGDFEDTIPFDIDLLRKQHIYLCRLDIIYKDSVVNGHTYKLLYTGTFFNNRDVQEFNNSNRPIIEANCDLAVEQSYEIKDFTYTTLLEDELGNIIVGDEKKIVAANDVMFLADNERYYRKIVGIILNVECEVTSELGIEADKFVKYNGEESPLHPLFAGVFASDLTLDNCAQEGKIICKIKNDDTVYKYEGDGDELVQEQLKKYVENTELIKEGSGSYRPLDGATITYTKQGNVYRNVCTIKIHRGIVSRLGQEDFYSVLLESLFPVYEPDNDAYNQKLFGFKMDEDGNLENIIGAEDFAGNSMWLAKNRAIDATLAVQKGMLAIEMSYDDDKYAVHRYDFKDDLLTPYHYGSYISDGVSIVNMGSAGTTRIEAMQQVNYTPILILATNCNVRVWDKSYWDGDVDSRICNLMVLPHSELGETLRSELRFKDDWDKNKEKRYGWMADKVRYNYIDGLIDKVGPSKRNLFKVSKGATKAMYILWRTLYGYLAINIATPIDVEYKQDNKELILVTPQSNGKLKVEWDNSKKDRWPVCETHLRADHMLFCLLSQILITKTKTTELLLNAPEVSQMYSTLGFKTKGKLTISGPLYPVLVLGENKDIEKALQVILSNGVLSPEDNFIPKFVSLEYTNGSINCGGKILMTTDRYGMINLDNLFYCEGVPEFSTVTAEERVNIYPGKIIKILGTYLCQLEKNRWGLYKRNESLIKNVNGKEKFYKIFLPTILSESNKEGSKYWCLNTDTYKLMLEGLAYNDVLLPLSRILKELGHELSTVPSQEDFESPFFNLLYYNSIDLNFVLEPGSCEGCALPVDYCHGFAFTTLFGDQSRYLDSCVYMRNLFDWKQFPGADWNKGYTSNRDCKCHDIFGKDRQALQLRTLPVDGQNLFKLGTADWTNAEITWAAGASSASGSSGSSDTSEPSDPTPTENSGETTDN